MSLLLTAVAVRHPSADDVIDLITMIARDAGGSAKVRPADAPRAEDAHDDVCVGAEVRGWVTVHPHYLVPADGLAVALSKRLGTVASATSVYEDVFWTHDLVRNGRVLDRYVNLPGYFGPDEYGPEHEGDPDLVADTLEVDRGEIAPYFEQISLERARSRLPPPKAHASDRFDLLDGWVITDLWRRARIGWGPEAPAAFLRLGNGANAALAKHLRAMPGA